MKEFEVIKFNHNGLFGDKTFNVFRRTAVCCSLFKSYSSIFHTCFILCTSDVVTRAPLSYHCNKAQWYWYWLLIKADTCKWNGYIIVFLCVLNSSIVSTAANPLYPKGCQNKTNYKNSPPRSIIIILTRQEIELMIWKQNYCCFWAYMDEKTKWLTLFMTNINFLNTMLF